MTLIMCVLWVVLFSLTLVAFFKGEIFMAKDTEVLEDLSRRGSNESVDREEGVVLRQISTEIGPSGTLHTGDDF